LSIWKEAVTSLFEDLFKYFQHLANFGGIMK
jgi:hypothetical protein